MAIIKNRFFGIAVVVNIVMWCSFWILKLVSYYIERPYSYDTLSGLLIAPLISTIIISWFLFYCFKLYNSLKDAHPMSDGSRIVGPLAAILFTLHTILFSWIAFENLKSFSTNFSEGALLNNIIFFLFIVTSIYLCVMFWIIRKKVMLKLNSIVKEIGSEDAVLDN